MRQRNSLLARSLPRERRAWSSDSFPFLKRRRPNDKRVVTRYVRSIVGIVESDELATRWLVDGSWFDIILCTLLFCDNLSFRFV